MCNKTVITLHAQTPGPAACPDYWRISMVNDQAMLLDKIGAYVVSSPVCTVNRIPVTASFVKATAHSERWKREEGRGSGFILHSDILRFQL